MCGDGPATHAEQLVGGDNGAGRERNAEGRAGVDGADGHANRIRLAGLGGDLYPSAAIERVARAGDKRHEQADHAGVIDADGGKSVREVEGDGGFFAGDDL